MPQQLDLSTWKRRRHYEFFRGYSNPYFNLCAEVDVTELARRCSAPDAPSFFLASLHASLRAANAVEELRYRMRGDTVVVHEVIHGGSTVLMPDETFVFAYFEYHPDFSRFAAAASAELERVRAGSGELQAHKDRDDLIHYSVLPWVSFTSFAHARDFAHPDSVPKIVFGKHHEVGGRRRMPVSVEVHHALADGLHVGKFFAGFQAEVEVAAAALRAATGSP